MGSILIPFHCMSYAHDAAVVNAIEYEINKRLCINKLSFTWEVSLKIKLFLFSSALEPYGNQDKWFADSSLLTAKQKTNLFGIVRVKTQKSVCDTAYPFSGSLFRNPTLFRNPSARLPILLVQC